MIVVECVESSRKHEAWSVGRTNALPRVACECAYPIHKRQVTIYGKRTGRQGATVRVIDNIVQIPRGVARGPLSRKRRIFRFPSHGAFFFSFEWLVESLAGCPGRSVTKPGYARRFLIKLR